MSLHRKGIAPSPRGHSSRRDFYANGMGGSDWYVPWRLRAREFLVCRVAGVIFYLLMKVIQYKHPSLKSGRIQTAACDASLVLQQRKLGLTTRSLWPGVFVGLASIHRSITTTTSTKQTHHDPLPLRQTPPTRHPTHITISQLQTAAMVQTTGMLGEGRHIHERMMGKCNEPD
jgi:hypothetical protein